MQNYSAKFHLLPELCPFMAIFHNNSPVTIHYSPVTTILNENPVTCFLTSTSIKGLMYDMLGHANLHAKWTFSKRNSCSYLFVEVGTGS